jgi:hypothetical protein
MYTARLHWKKFIGVYPGLAPLAQFHDSLTEYAYSAGISTAIAIEI